MLTSAMWAGLTGALSAAPVFTVDPTSPASAAVGNSFSASFAVTGTTSPIQSYSISNLPPGLSVLGATPSSTHLVLNSSNGTITGVPTTAGTYVVGITAWDFFNESGNSVVNSYTIIVAASQGNGAPSISAQPASQTVTAGQLASFNVTAAGQAPLTYQWRKDGTNISGANSSTYSISTAVSADAGTYSVVVVNAVGNVTSLGAVLTVTSTPVAPTIVTSPSNLGAVVGQSVFFGVAVTGTGPLTYQWRKDTVNIPGATSSSYSITSVVAGDAGSYSVVVSNSLGSAVSSPARLTVSTGLVAPSIATPPANLSLLVGALASFTVSVNGTSPLTYQWRKNGADISGATDVTYSIAAVTTADAGTYSVVVTNSTGSATSAGATLDVNTTAVAPAITVQPASQTVTVSQTTTFSVTATGTSPLLYQWRKDGADISGATASIFVLIAPVVGDAGSYSVAVTNTAGTATSNAATLTVNPISSALSITDQPDNQSVTVGQLAAFNVTASGEAPLSYQWRKDGVNIAGATSATFSVSSAAVDDAGTYTVVVTNSATSVTSNGAVLTVTLTPLPPTIVAQPANTSATLGSSAFFAVTVNGTAPLTYQWRKNNVDIVGATAGSFSILVVGASDAGTYSVAVTNTLGSVISNPATLTVQTGIVPPSFSTQPSNLNLVVGSPAAFTITVNGTDPLTYQWRKDGVDIAGATATTYTIAAVATADAGTYSVVATNAAGSATSNGATLTVTSTAVSPTISSQPVAQSVAPGQAATFKVTVAGTMPLTYQWRKDGVDLAGAILASLTISAAATTDAGTYSVVVTNAAGTATSIGVALTVTPVITLPTFSTQPSSQVVTSGHAVSFQAVSNATINQWQVSSDRGGTWTNISNGGIYSGATTGTLTITGATAALNNNLYRYSATNDSGINYTAAATLTVTAVLLPAPSGIAVDQTGLIYVADSTSNTIQSVTASGVVSLLAGGANLAGALDGSGSAARFNQPGGVVALASGLIFVADTGNSTIRRIDSNGAVTTFAGSSTTRGNANGSGTSASFSNPFGIAADAAGNLYVADAGNHTIRFISAAGTVSTFAGGAGTLGSADGASADARFNGPSGVAVDPSGNVYVADTTNNTIRKITAGGTVSTLAGLAGVSGATDGSGGVALFNHPMGIAVDASGYVYVADTGNSTIRRITPAGLVSTVAGLSTVAGGEDGTGSTAFFNLPKALAVDNVGNLYVSDTGNAALRLVSSGSGAVTTFALTAASTGGTGGGGSTGGAGGTGGTGGGGSTGGGGGSIDGWLVLALAALAGSRRAFSSRDRRGSRSN